MPPSLQDASAHPLRFDRRQALAALPWFELDGDEVVIADRSVGPIIDCHTHLALPALRPHRYDLERPSTGDHLLLEACCPHDLDVYANLNFSPRMLRGLHRELVLGGLFGHGKRRHHTAPNLERDMRSVGVTQSWVLAIDFWFPSHHVADTLTTARAHERFIALGSVYPRRRDARERFEEQMHEGAQGIKLHPPNMMLRPDAPEAMRVYAWCGRVGVPVFWHCGPAGIEPKAAQARAQVSLYERPIAENPKTMFVLGHAGARQHREALALQRRYPNTWLEISGQSVSALVEILREGDPERVLFGSDWPFYHPVMPLAKVLIATEDRPELRRLVLHDNAARLMERVPRRS